MNDMEYLVIDSDPKIINEKIIETEHNIDDSHEISISINNSIILDKLDIENIQDNQITLLNILLTKKDVVVVIYNKEQ